MTINVQLMGQFTASVTDGDWVVPDMPAIAELLSLTNPPNTPDIPNYDWACAQAAVECFGEQSAQIISPHPAAAEGDGKVY